MPFGGQGTPVFIQVLYWLNTIVNLIYPIALVTIIYFVWKDFRKLVVKLTEPAQATHVSRAVPEVSRSVSKVEEKPKRGAAREARRDRKAETAVPSVSIEGSGGADVLS